VRERLDKGTVVEIIQRNGLPLNECRRLLDEPINDFIGDLCSSVANSNGFHRR
jgi:hypothetical protein